jgi:hypothetical protein
MSSVAEVSTSLTFLIIPHELRVYIYELVFQGVVIYFQEESGGEFVSHFTLVEVDGYRHPYALLQPCTLVTEEPFKSSQLAPFTFMARNGASTPEDLGTVIPYHFRILQGQS